MALGLKITEKEKEVTEENLVESIKDAAAIITKLEPFCSDFSEMLLMLSHAIENPAQLRLLIKHMSEK